MSVRSLFSAVRSQLHFSQLAAWLSTSGGAHPRHVCYRLALPALSEATGAFAASRFARPPLEHVFPPAPLALGGPALQVTVKMLPRMDAPPVLHCPLHPNGASADVTPAMPGKLRADTAVQPGICGLEATTHDSVSPMEGGASEALLGDSLLDPPPSLQLLRCRAPRMHSPPLAILPRGAVSAQGCISRRDGSPPSPPCTSIPLRRGRQGMARRRDTSSGGMTSLCRFKAGIGNSSGGLLDDRMQNPCTRPGKHHCHCAYEDDAADCGSSPVVSTADVSLPASTTMPHTRTADTSLYSELNITAHFPKSCRAGKESKNRKLSLELSQSEVEEVLAVLRDRNPSTRLSNQNGKIPVLSPLARGEPDSNYLGSKHHMLPSVSSEEPSTEVYHSKPSTTTSTAVHKADVLLDAILRARCPAKRLLPVLRGCDTDERVTKDRTKISSDRSAHKSHTFSLMEMPKKISSSPVPLLHRRLRQHKVSCARPPQLKALQIPESAGEMQSRSELSQTTAAAAAQMITVPSAQETALFRRSLRSAACMVFHCRTGLPLTSSPAPVRRHHDSARFDFDSSLNSVSAIRCALFEARRAPKNSGGRGVRGLSSPTDESEACTESPESPEISPHALSSPTTKIPGPAHWPRFHLSHCSSLLGSFEESVLNGRLEPVSTVQGFTADLGASGTFCPRHLLLPVTVFFYTLGDNDKVSTPYLAHINLGKKGYTVPRAGTIQVTLLNPLGTVVKMFVVQYDLSDMPPQATTFLRQRTLYLPADGTEDNSVEAQTRSQALQKHLRYLIHLRFSSSRSGRISLHTDIRMIIFRKSDLDTATAHGGELSYELRSFTHGPTNPKFSPRK